MSGSRLVVVTNGPGELMGWARTFLRSVYARSPLAEVTVVFVPCRYATGREPDVTRQLFPRATVIGSGDYGRFWMKRRVPGLHRGPGALQYLGGDLYHSALIAKRLGLRAMTYKFTKRSYRNVFDRFFATDEANAVALRGAAGLAPENTLAAFDAGIVAGADAE